MEKIGAGDPSAPVRAAAVLARGGVALVPTDTIYGLAADALSDDAVARVYAIKGRDKGKPMHAIVAELAMAARYGVLNDAARTLARRFLPGPLTLVVKKKAEETSGIMRDFPTFGFRIPDDQLCRAIARAFDGPVTATSANKSGLDCENGVDAILRQLGGAAGMIDLVVDAGKLPERKASTVVDVSGPDIKILREAAIAANDIFSCF